MQPIPDFCEDETEDIADNRSEEDDCNRRRYIEGLYDNRYADHMRPHTEVHERLCPSEGDENRPHEVHAAEEFTERESCLRRVKVIH